MEQEKVCYGNSCGGHGCGQCGGNGQWGGGHHGHFLLRLIIGLVIIGAVFSLGVKVGEFKGMYDGERHNYRMMEMMQGANY